MAQNLAPRGLHKALLHFDTMKNSSQRDPETIRGNETWIKLRNSSNLGVLSLSMEKRTLKMYLEKSNSLSDMFMIKVLSYGFNANETYRFLSVYCEAKQWTLSSGISHIWSEFLIRTRFLIIFSNSERAEKLYTFPSSSRAFIRALHALLPKIRYLTRGERFFSDWGGDFARTSPSSGKKIIVSCMKRFGLRFIVIITVIITTGNGWKTMGFSLIFVQPNFRCSLFHRKWKSLKSGKHRFNIKEHVEAQILDKCSNNVPWVNRERYENSSKLWININVKECKRIIYKSSGKMNAMHTIFLFLKIFFTEVSLLTWWNILKYKHSW